MSRLVTYTAAAAMAAAACGVALSQGLGGIAPPPPPAEEPAPPPPAAEGGLVKSFNLAAIKAVFDANNVPATREKTSGGFQYVAATLGGNFVATAPLDCPNGDPNGECGAIVMLSGTWSTKLTPAQLDQYHQDFRLSTALTVGSGEPMLRYIFLVGDGVGAKYLENSLVSFAYDMQGFGEFLAKTKKGPGSAFSAGPEAAEKASKFSSSVDLGAVAGPTAKGGKLTP